MSSQERQDTLLRQIVEADDAASDTFFTASSMDGTTLFHDGLPGRQLEIGIQDIKSLAARGLLLINEHRKYGDVAFAVTPAGRAEAERLASGGKTEAEVQRDRADLAEAALRAHLDDDARAAGAIDERRRRTASVLATVPALLVAIVAGLVAFAISQSGPLATAVIAVLGILGVATSWLVNPLRSAIARRLIRPLRFIHDRT